MGIGYEVHVYSQWKDEKTADKDNVVPADASRNPGLFNEVLRRNPTLPQYHPKYLIELLDFGKLRRVRAILNHLVSGVITGHIFSSHRCIIVLQLNLVLLLIPHIFVC